MDDFQLLQQYASARSDTAMTRLVSRYVDIVYASAVRRLRGDRAMAEDVTQAVFIIFFRKAGSLRPETQLTAWLLNTTRYVAANAIRLAQIRRRHEHRVAAEMSVMMRDRDDRAAAEDRWAELAPLLDDAIAALRGPERRAVLMRFFEKRSLAEIGQYLQISPEAARKRIDRAIEKLRHYFARRGITTAGASVLLVLEHKVLEAAPLDAAQAATRAASISISALSPRLETLVEGAMRMMILKQVRAAAAVVVLCLSLAGAVMIAAVHFSNSSSVVAAAEPAPAAAAPAADQPVQQLIAHHIEARGGRERLAAVQSFRMSGPLDFGAGTARLITEQRRPNLFRQEFIVGDQRNVRAFDGRTGWSHIPFLGVPEPTVVSDEELKNLTDEADFDGPLVDPQNKGHKVESLGKETIDDRECWKLKVTLRTGNQRFDYLDVETMQVVRIEGRQIENGQEVDYVQRFGDFREVDGVLFPFEIAVEQSAAGGQAQAFLHRVEDIELNVPLDDDRFRMPATQPTTRP